MKMQGKPSFFHSIGRRLFCPSTGSTPKRKTFFNLSTTLKYPAIKLMEEKGETKTPSMVQQSIPQVLWHLNRTPFAFFSNLFSASSAQLITLPPFKASG
jgi:hypothetical protein